MAGCTTIVPTPTATPAPETGTATADLPPAVEYNLGEATVVQANFPEGNRFRDMPVRLNGVIAVPPADGPHPVVVILHGTHPGCPELEGGVDRWPCAPEDERPNYRGFAYLVSALADKGYVALAPNINAENTFGFGEPVPGERLTQLLRLQMDALAAAANGGPNAFGVELEGRADLQRVALLGHSRGAEAAAWLANAGRLAAPDAFETFGYGPVRGVLAIAPAVIFTLPGASIVPMAVLLAACDGDVIDQAGQLLYEGARTDPAQREWLVSAWLEQANHNSFNETLPADPFGTRGRPDCESLLEPDAQRAFLSAFAGDFLAAIFATDAAAKAQTRLGMDATTRVPDSLFGLPARVATLAPAADRRTLVIPTGAEELVTHRLGGAVSADGVTTFFCEAGYYTPFTNPGTEPCRRVNVTIPGNPALVVVSWEQPGAALRFTLPAGTRDLRAFSAISLRAAVDPISALNAAGTAQAFSVRLTDGAGASATVLTRPDEPALVYPPGVLEEDDDFAGGLFNGLAPMTTVRLLLDDFAGVDLGDIREIAFIFDQTPAGSLFMGDLELVQPSGIE